MEAIFFLFETAVSLYIYVLILRVGMQWVKADYFNPASQFVIKVTHPLVSPIRGIIPALGPIDTASLVVAYLFSIIKCLLIFKFAASAIFFYALLSLIKAIGFFIFWLLIIRVITSWLNRQHGGVDHLILQLTEPLIAPIRRFIPPIAGLDFSAMILFFFLIFLNKLAIGFFGALWIIV